MKRIFSRILSLMVCLGILAGLLPVGAAAEEQRTLSVTQVNPLYEDVVTEEDLLTIEDIPVFFSEEIVYFTTLDEAITYLREGMEQRMPLIQFGIQADSWDLFTGENIYYMLSTAMEHTGMPTEGDYLLWQYAGWDCDATATQSGSAYYMIFPYVLTYYTTAEQEEMVTAEIESVLASLNLEGRSDYGKIRAVYDYITRNVTYDYANLDDDSYMLKHTAYAALIDGTAVCQGYALLLYRMLLELGIDCRFIGGTSSGGGHGWNIIKLGDVYYNADSTWDAGEAEYDYFLVSDDNFPDHTRDDVYSTTEFYEKYPMAEESYAVCDVPTSDYVPAVTPPTCAAGGYTTYTCPECGDSYVDSVTDALGHSFTAYVSNGNATCTADGTKTAKCDRCDVTNIVADVDSALGHDYESVITPPDCTKDGYTTHACSRCGDTYVDSHNDALGHDLGEWTVTKNAACTVDGEKRRDCSACSYYETEVIKAAGHRYQDGMCAVCGDVDPDYSESAATVIRLSGSGRCETAYKLADELKAVLGVEKFDVIIIANGDGFADALAGSYLASVKEAPILMYRANRVQQNLNYITKNLSAGGKVYILGGTASVGTDMEEALKGFDVERLAGNNRLETNLKILKEAGVTGGEILVATGWNFADSLSASATGLPILLVNNDSGSLTSAQKTYLASLKNVKFTVIGGPNSVGENLATELSAYGKVSRVSGTSRVVTSVAVAKRFFNSPDCVVLADAMNYPDGLCAGPLAYAMNAPLILTSSGKEAVAKDYVAANGITKGIISGGPNSVSDETANIIFPMGESDVLNVAELTSYGMSYAAGRGFILDYNLGVNGGVCGYNPPSTYTFTSMETARSHVAGKVNSLYNTLTNLGEDITKCRINVTVVDNGDGTYTLTAYYG